MNKFALAFGVLVAFWIASSPASAQDPLVAGVGRFGTHPRWGSGFTALWRNDVSDQFNVLLHSSNTYINAPNASGGVYMRVADQDRAAFLKDRLYLYTNTEVAENLYVLKDLFAQRDTSFRGTATFESLADFWNGLHSDGSADFHGGMYVEGGTYVDDSLTVTGLANLSAGIKVATSNVNDWAATFDGGKYGISTSGSVYALMSEGPAYVTGKLTGTWVEVQNDLTVLAGGTAHKPGGGAWLATSDRRVKKEVAEFRTGLEAIEQVQPVRFKYNGLGGTENSNQEYVGVIAQDLEPVAPYMVSSEKKKLKPTDQALSDIKSVDPSAFTYLLVNAVKELSQQNKELKVLVCQDHPTAALCRGSGKSAAQKKSGLQQGLARKVE